MALCTIFCLNLRSVRFDSFFAFVENLGRFFFDFFWFLGDKCVSLWCYVSGGVRGWRMSLTIKHLFVFGVESIVAPRG